MNEPEYILTDIFADIVAEAAAKYGSPIRYEYGYVTQLNETLLQYSTSDKKFQYKWPLVWLAEPYTEDLSVQTSVWYSETEIRLFIIKDSGKNWKSSRRMEENYKAVLLPVYRALIAAIQDSAKLSTPNPLPHKKTNRYWWGEQQQSVINDVVDVMEISNIKLKINNNPNCDE